jgi:hypothetical protein
LIFLLDHNLSPRFARALAALGTEVKALRDEFPNDIPDESLLVQLGSRRWHFVTQDKHILTRPQEAAALRQAKVTAFFLGPFFSSLQFWEQAVWLVKHWPRFEEMGRNMSEGTCLMVKNNGKMNPVMP